MKYCLTLPIATFLWAFAAHANELENCVRTAKNSDANAHCYVEESERQDKLLNQWIAKNAKLPDDLAPYIAEGISKERLITQRRLLVESQNAWRRFRDKWCEYNSASTKGTGMAGVHWQCKVEMNKKRLEQLKTWSY